ncbi:maestro heat-like repeat-containing protein family member 1 [Myotis lucifugus]|uniref:maestro heat-like repeat-containing protein family member 1 n=1 Tax=Myotis lucifugus TaxID=59463 RepID=UPI000CCC6985|nr:maestro heat-like repeat-containing protein family member 1 [Myotis lucifugus]
MCSRKPYREKEFGTSSLRLLSALHPITSLHPVINHSVGQLWRKVIPQMLEILDGHTEKSLNQEEWVDRLFRFLSQSLVAIDDDRWQEQLIRVILERIRYFIDDGDEKAFLYKFFGFALWTSRSEKLVKMMLSAILQTSHENVQEREGIAVAFSVVSRKHLRTVLEQLKVYSAVLTDKESSSILTLAKEHQPREWVLVCHTIYLSYSKIILESKGDIFMHFDAVLALILQHYHNCILEKDKDLKLGYLNALIILTKTLGRQQHVAFQFKFPHKLAIVTFMLDLIKEEPLNSISSPIRQKAMNVINNFRMFRPLLGIEERVELLGTCFKSVFCLPSIEVLRKEASSPKEGQANVDLFEGTMESLLRLMETLIVEMPTRIQNCLQLMDPWLNSQKDNERERAMWCAARILEFTAKMEDFSMEIEFTRLGRLVKLLAMRCQDPVDSICFLSAKAVYHLYCILLKKKQMKKKIQGLWMEEDMDEVYSANLFYNNTFEIAEAFAEYFTQSQLTNLVLTAMEELTGSRAKVSLAAAQLMSAVMKKRGSDLIKVEEIVVGILERLKLHLEPNTKEETLRALCLLAGNSTHSVVPLLLNRPLPWDRTILALWKVFGTERKTTIKVLQLLIGILENHSTEGTTEKALEPVKAAFALCEMLSGTLCPRLLLAVLCHLFWVIEQKTPQNVVVYRKDGGSGKTLDSTSCALEVVKLVFFAAAYDGVVVYADEHKCWDHLSSSKFYYRGIMDLTSGIVKNCEAVMLHRILKLAKTFLDSGDNHRKTLARAVYAQLLWHRSVAQTLGQDFVGNLIKWTKEPNLIMKEIGLRGISNLALHPSQSESVKSLFPSLPDFLKSEARVTVQAVKALRNIIYHGHGEEVKAMFCSISRHLRPLINDERDQVRIIAISSLGHMLHRVNKFKPGYAIKKHLYSFLVPLLLSLEDNNTEVVKACGAALTEWTNVIGWSSFTQMFQHTTLSDHMQVLEETCNHLVNTCKRQLVGELLFQSFSFLKSSESFLRTAAVHFIALIAKKINLHSIHEDDVQLLRNALESMKNDPVESIQILVTTLLQNIEEYVNPEDSSTSIISTRFFRLRGRKALKRKRHLFKTVRRKGDNDTDRPRNWLLGPLNLLWNWCKGG